MAQFGSSELSADETDAVAGVVADKGEIDLNIHRGLGGSVPGVAIERRHSIVIAVARYNRITTAGLRD